MFALGLVASVMCLEYVFLFHYKLQLLCSYYQYKINFIPPILVLTEAGAVGANISQTVEQSLKFQEH